MKLKEFVESVLLDILHGVRKAQENEKVGPFIVPGDVAGMKCAEHPRVSINAGISTTIVDFDIAVTVEKSRSGEGKGGIRIVSFDLSAGGQVGTKNTHANRIQFGVPVLLPQNQESWFDAPERSK